MAGAFSSLFPLSFVQFCCTPLLQPSLPYPSGWMGWEFCAGWSSVLSWGNKKTKKQAGFSVNYLHSSSWMSVLPCLLPCLLACLLPCSFCFLDRKPRKKPFLFSLPPHVTKWNIVSFLLLSLPVLLCFRHLVLDAVALYFPYLFLSVLVVLLVTGYYFLVTLYFVFFSLSVVCCVWMNGYFVPFILSGFFFFMTMIGLLGGCKWHHCAVSLS